MEREAQSKDEQQPEDRSPAIDNEEKALDNLANLARKFTKLHHRTRSLQRSVEGTIKFSTMLQKMHQMFFRRLDQTQRKHIALMWNELHERLLLVREVLQQRLIASQDYQAECQASVQTVRRVNGNQGEGGLSSVTNNVLGIRTHRN